MAALPTPSTELEAVNVLLSTIGETPVNTLTESTSVDVAVAKLVLTEVSRDVQGRAWHFNIEDDYPLHPTTDGEIVLPPNILRVDVNPNAYPDIDPVQRGNRLYDKVTHSFAFKGTLYATVVIFLPFDQLTESARRYITVKAARVYADRQMGITDRHTYTKQDEFDALALLRKSDSATGNPNIFRGSARKPSARFSPAYTIQRS